MVVKVYIWMLSWEPGKLQFGHASVQVGPDTYISWWPITRDEEKGIGLVNVVVSVAANQSESYDEDRQREEQEADHIFEIDELDEEAIVRWWAREKERNEYHLRSNNCCTMVYKALQQGGALQRLGWWSRHWWKATVVWYQGNLRRFCRQVAKR